MTDPAQPVVSWAEPDRVVGPAPGIEFAPHGQRLVAYLIDSVLLLALTFGVILLPIAWAQGRIDGFRAAGGSIEPVTIVVIVASFVALFAVIFLYFPLFWATGGATPGMRLFRLRVVRDLDGGRIGWGTALLRLVGMYVASSVFYLGFIWVFVDKRRRGWHDLIASTVVIRQTGEGAEGVRP